MTMERRAKIRPLEPRDVSRVHKIKGRMCAIVTVNADQSEENISAMEIAIRICKQWHGQQPMQQRLKCNIHPYSNEQEAEFKEPSAKRQKTSERNEEPVDPTIAVFKRSKIVKPPSVVEEKVEVKEDENMEEEQEEAKVVEE